MMRCNFSHLMDSSIGSNGLKKEDFAAISRESLEKIHSRPHREMDWLDLPESGAAAVKEMARHVRTFENFLVLGIGGSALGPRAILEGLSPFHNYLRKPRVFIYDNVDPLTLNRILEIIDLRQTVINVISKSGSTAETIASFLIIWKKLEEQNLAPENHLIITTDPEKGGLRQLVRQYRLRSLSLLPGVGGRYSVLSPVGLLSAEVIGIDADELLRGARDINLACRTADLWRNPAYLFASGVFLLHSLKGRNITVMIPYADRLKCFSEWFCQLWAESLGKEGKGLTPYPSVGTTDQHSQLQLWMEGPQDKLVIFLSVEDYGVDVTIPGAFPGMEGFSYLDGHTLSELIKTEQIASEIALSKNSRPSITVKLPRIDAYHLGQLFQFFEIVTAIEGFLLGINPFDQPGVEEGKNLTYGFFGKKGYEAKQDEFKQYTKGEGFEL